MEQVVAPDRPPRPGAAAGVSREVRGRLLDLVLERDELADLDEAERRLALRGVLGTCLSGEELPEAIALVAEEIDGFGRLSVLMEDPAVTDVVVNGPHEVWVEREGRLERTGVRFEDRAELVEFVQRLLARSGGRADPSHPLTDARLPDGSRLHVVLPPIAPAGPLLSIRRFPAVQPRLAGLVEMGLLRREEAARLARLVTAGRTIVVSGGTGSGKTTLLGALLAEVPQGERVVTIEETPELRAPHPHLVSLIVRGANVEGAGSIDQADLVRASLRMRPDRIVVGEVRGAEALDALAAMSTGHEGSLMTIHARSAAHARERMVALALQAPSHPGAAALARAVEDSFDVVVHLERREGARRLVEIQELR